MNITGTDICKSFNNTKIIQNIGFSVSPEKPCAITGQNGSGKSTLIKIIANIIKPDSGLLNYYDDNATLINHNNIHEFISFVAPYSELIEEFTLEEQINFHSKFVKPLSGFDTALIINKLNFEKQTKIKIKEFSSGMKQKLKIALALFFSKKILLFDEPCVNFDNKSIDWYGNTITSFSQNKIIIVCSNNAEFEYFFSNQRIEL